MPRSPLWWAEGDDNEIEERDSVSESMTKDFAGALLMMLADSPQRRANAVTEVARLMRRRAEAASKGTWRAGGIGDFGWSVSADQPFPGRSDALSVETSDSDQGLADAVHLAAMANPAVALHLADWLENCAADYQAEVTLDLPEYAVAVARDYLAADVEERA